MEVVGHDVVVRIATVILVTGISHLHAGVPIVGQGYHGSEVVPPGESCGVDVAEVEVAVVTVSVLFITYLSLIGLNADYWFCGVSLF